MSMSTHSTVSLCNLFKRVQNNNLFTYNYFIQNIAELQTGYPGAIFFSLTIIIILRDLVNFP